MSTNRIRGILLILLWALLAIGLHACSGDLVLSAANPAVPGSSSNVEIDPVFREYYQKMGGEAVLGLAIATSRDQDGYQEQYLKTVLLRRNPLAPADQQFSLAPLGQKLYLRGQPTVSADPENRTILNGFVIYSKFMPLYQQLGGSDVAGLPLTQPQVDHEQGRIAQYFENLGFYTALNDPADSVHLLAYGANACPDCKAQVPEIARVKINQEFSEPWIDALVRVGFDLVGKPLTGPYQAPDGNDEQVYENVVVFVKPGENGLVNFRPLPALTRYPPSPLVEPQNGKGLIFEPLQGALGHNVPAVFETFIAEHGGALLAGPPTSELFKENSVYRQCFNAYCLDYDPSIADETLRITPVPLGKEYLDRRQAQSSKPENPPLASADIYMVASEEYRLISSDLHQKITLMVLEDKSQKPLLDVEATLSVTLPDGKVLAIPMPPTDSSGNSEVILDPIAAANSTIIPYKVCLKLNIPNPPCQESAFTIWGNP